MSATEDNNDTYASEEEKNVKEEAYAEEDEEVADDYAGEEAEEEADDYEEEADEGKEDDYAEEEDDAEKLWEEITLIKKSIADLVNQSAKTAKKIQDFENLFINFGEEGNGVNGVLVFCEHMQLLLDDAKQTIVKMFKDEIQSRKVNLRTSRRRLTHRSSPY